MTSLRQELLAADGVPTMRMLVPGGWDVMALDDEGMAAFTARMRAVLMPAHRPDIDAYLSGSLRTWVGQLRKSGGLYAILPLDPPEGTALPMSFVVSVVSDVAGAPLERWVTEKIRGGDTEFLDDQRTVLAWRSSTRGIDEMAGTVSDQYNYLIPVPGSDLRRAVLLTGTRLALATEDIDSPPRVAARTLYDAMALALDWAPSERMG